MIRYQLIKELCKLSQQGGKEKLLCLVSWNGRPKKLDIRLWLDDKEQEELSPGKGITLTDEEARLLLSALQEYFERPRED